MTGRSHAVFLDRDGTLIEDVGYPRDPKQVRLLPHVVESLQRLADRGYALIVASNQSGIGRGLVTAKEAERVHGRLIELLAAEGVEIRGAFYCPHAPEAECACRKPVPGLLLQAAEKLGVDLRRSFMVGDKLSDVEAGKRAGCRSILFGCDDVPPDAAMKPDAVVPDWQALVRWILEHEEVVK